MRDQSRDVLARPWNVSLHHLGIFTSTLESAQQQFSCLVTSCLRRILGGVAMYGIIGMLKCMGWRWMVLVIDGSGLLKVICSGSYLPIHE